MADIRINEYSQTYTYNVGNSGFATVAMPITSSWGDGYSYKHAATTNDASEIMWKLFPSTQEGMSSFVQTYRGPATTSVQLGDYSYQMALTLLASGYDLLTCRVSALGSSATDDSGKASKAVPVPVIKTPASGDDPAELYTLTVRAKYVGSFGNNLFAEVTPTTWVGKTGTGGTYKYLNVVIRVLNNDGSTSAVENFNICLDPANETSSVTYIGNAESEYITISLPTLPDGVTTTGWDLITTSAQEAYDTQIATFDWKLSGGSDMTGSVSTDLKSDLASAAIDVYDLLKDKLNYDFQRVISPGWDQWKITTTTIDSNHNNLDSISVKLMDVAANCRCGTALIDIPQQITKSFIKKSDGNGYIQKLSRTTATTMDGLFTTHAAAFAPWGQYLYVGESRMLPASPSFLALLIQINMLKRQTLQYEWLLPSSRTHSLNIGKLDFTVNYNTLQDWVSDEGVSLNVITTIPGVGPTIWGNNTLWDAAPATYQALHNLSTRYLVNAIENVAYKCSLGITFQYNNGEAYSTFYAGVTPILDTMKNAGAIEDYMVKMASDVDSLGQVKANSVVGKIYLVINGVINNVTVDLICLPPQTDLTQYA